MTRTWIAISAAGGAALILGAGLLLHYFWFAPTARFDPPRIVTVARGESFRKIATVMARAGIVRSSIAMELYGQWTGCARSIKPGRYSFRGGERVPEVVAHLVRGDFLSVSITIPEGLTVEQVGERLEAAGLACATSFEREARGGRLVRALGLEPLGAEGYLFPATYRFSPGADERQILFVMLKRFYRLLTPEVESRLFELGLTEAELVTMASMVEKEARAKGERRLIAGVFFNRLRRKMPLQSDPTAEYGRDLDGAGTAEAVRIPSAFNTYGFVGLPPGPIANPGPGALDAVLYPAATNYLYFVARNDGTHVFSRTFNEHRRAIARLRRVARRHFAHRPNHADSGTVR